MRIRQLLQGEKPVGSTVTVRGWIRTRRDSKAGLSFIALNDGSCLDAIQVIAPNTLSNYDRDVVKLTTGCAIKATGILVESPGKGQHVEIQAEQIDVIGWVDQPESYPMQPKRHTMEFLREVAHLRPRTNVMGAVTRVRAALAQAIHRFFHDRDFFWINTPIITASDCEGAGEMFRVSSLDLSNLPMTEQGRVNFKEDFFGQESFLTVSGQLNVEAYALALSNVYTFGPTFRAENSNTSRHLAEFWMIEPEIAFANLQDDIELADALLRNVIRTVLEERADDMDLFNRFVDKTCLARLQAYLDSELVTMTYSDAIDALLQSKQKFEYPVEWGLDLQSEHERYLCEEVVKGPVVVTDYPKEIKSFYMRVNDDGKTVAAMDMLVPGMGEIIGGSQREERLDYLDQRIAELNIDATHYQWYRDLRRYGTVPHAGFGMGFERLICYVTGLKNVRDVIPFPRTPNTVTF